MIQSELPQEQDNQSSELKNILDAKAVQSLMDDFYLLTNIGIAIIDLHGEVLVATGWQDVCTQFHRVNSISRLNCVESDTLLSLNVEEGEYREYKCRSNMWDIATPIFVSGKHVGNLFLGQFFYDDELVDIKAFEEQAERYGFDKESYLDALNRVPRWSRDKVKTVMSFYSKFAKLISKLLTGNLSLERSLEENKRTIQELKASNSELEQYAYVVSHDLKEPIRMVSNYTELLERKCKDKLDDDAKQYISFITSGTKRMNSLVSDLLKYSRINKETYTTFVDCNKILGEVLEDLHLVIEEKHAEIFNSPLPEIKINTTHIKQLLQNLIENAVKFNNKSKPKVFISSEYKNGEYVFSVRDNGIGIEPEFHKKIFTLFQRLHGQNDYPGTGVGLAISQKIVEQYRGRIWVESEVGKGSTFYFTLPTF